MKSDEIDQLAAALVQFQSKMFAVGKNKSGYRDQYTYPTLGKVIEFAYPVMTELGLSVSQIPDCAGETPALTTTLMHTSGQWISGTYPIANAGMKSAVNTAQQFGAAISYARRYALLAVLGLAAEDDDAHCLSEQPRVATEPKTNPAPQKPNKKAAIAQAHKNLKAEFAVGFDAFLVLLEKIGKARARFDSDADHREAIMGFTDAMKDYSTDELKRANEVASKYLSPKSTEEQAKEVF